MTATLTRSVLRVRSTLGCFAMIVATTVLNAPALAQCDITHTRDKTADHVEITFKNETDHDIDLLIEKADYEDQSERKTVKSKTVKAGTKSQYDSTMSQQAKKTFFITYSGISGKFSVLNDKYYPTNQPAAYSSEYRGAKLSPITSQSNVECTEKYKSNNFRWSVSIQVN